MNHNLVFSFPPHQLFIFHVLCLSAMKGTSVQSQSTPRETERKKRTKNNRKKETDQWIEKERDHACNFHADITD